MPGELTRVHRRFGQFHQRVESDSGAAGTRAGGRLSSGFAGSVRTGLGRATTGVSSVLGGAMATFGRFGAVGVTALGAVGAAGVGMGVKIAAGNENAQIAFTTMLGSGKKARDFLGELQQFAAKTPFEFPELQTAASSLISAGVNAKNVIPIMTSLGNATSGMGTGAEGVKRATVALQQMNAAGRITAEDLNQLRDAGIPVYDLLASATGKSKKEVAALAQTGKLGAKELNQLMGALADGKGLERFDGLMEKQSASLAGMWSTVKDNLGQGLARAVAPVIPLLKDGMGGAATIIANSLAKLPPILKGTVRFVRALGSEVGLFWRATKAREAAPLTDALHSIWASLVLLFPALHSTKSAAGGMASAFPIVGAVIHGVVRGVGLLAKGLAWLADNQDVVRGAAHRLGEVLKPVGAAIRRAWDAVRSIDGDDVSRAFDKVMGVLHQLGPMLKDFSGGLPALTPTLHAVGEGLQFVAQHADLVGKALPYLIAGFAAYKAAQAANAAVGRESLVGFGLQLGTTVALTASNFALASSQRAVEGTEKTGIITRIRSVAVMIAHGAATAASTVATIAAGAASRVFAAGQWLVNAALTANPIGLVVVGIALLVGGLIYAYKHSERFRAIVDKTFSWIRENVPKALQAAWHGIKAAWDAITGAFSDAYHWVIGTFRKNWGLIRAVLLGPVGLAVRAIVRHWDDITGAFGRAKDWVTGTWRKGWAAVGGAISGAVTAGRDKVSDAWDSVRGKFSAAKNWATGTWKKGWSQVSGAITGAVSRGRDNVGDAWDSITGKFTAARKWVTGSFKRAWSGVKLILTDPVQAGHNAVDNLLGKDTGIRHLFDAAVRWLRGSFKRAWSGIKTWLTDPVQAAKNTLVNLLGEDNASGLRGRFSSFVRAAGRIWDGLKAALKSPIVAVIKIINTGLIGAYNWVLDKLHVGGHLDDIKIKGFRTGGPTGSRLSDDEPVGVVHANEHVATADEVRRGGGHGTWERARALARAGRLQDAIEGGMPGHRDGGATMANPSGRMTMDGKAISRIAAAQIRLAEQVSGISMRLMQGGFGGSHVAASGSSHNYPGVADLSPGSIAQEKVLRQVGFAAWARNVGGRSRVGSGAHNHAVSLLDPGDAHSPQVTGSWARHGNGLSGSNNDPAPHYPWLPNLKERLGAVNLSNLGDGDGGMGAPVKAAWLGRFANPAAFLRDRANTLMNKAGLGELGRAGWAGAVRAAPSRLLDAAVDKAKGFAASLWHTAGAAVSSAKAAIADVAVGGSNRVRGMALLTAAGFNPVTQWGALNKLWTRESGWRTTAENPSSHAYGIPQALPGSKMASVGGDWRTNANTQIRWGLGYIRDRYGTPKKAWDHSQATGWYANGTPSAARGFGWTAEKAAELVLNPQLRKFSGGEQVLNPRDTAKVLGGGGQQPLIGSVTLVSSGNVHRDLDEVMFRVRTASRGGAHVGG